jgi:opacity protein-like surface antigen
MKMFVGAFAAASLFAIPAFAQGTNGQAYYQVNLGSGVGGDAHLSGSLSAGTASASGSTNVHLQAGFFGSGALGYSFKNGVAMEVEGLYSRNNGDTKGAFGVDSAGETYGGMGNLLYAITQVGPVVPYVGGGIGYGVVRYSSSGYSTDDSGFMWQARAGVSGDLGRNMRWDIGYRYLQSPEYKLSGSATVLGTSVSGSAKLDTHTHVIAAGFRQRF